MVKSKTKWLTVILVKSITILSDIRFKIILLGIYVDCTPSFNSKSGVSLNVRVNITPLWCVIVTPENSNSIVWS